MEVVEQMLLSILSVRTKKIVCSLNLRSERFTLGAHESCDLEFRFFNLTVGIDFKMLENRAVREALVTEIPEIVRLNVFEEVTQEILNYQWENRIFKVRDYIDHFMEILHHDWIDDKFVGSEDMYSPESIQQLINGLEIRHLSFTEGHSDDDLINHLNAIKPSRSFYLNRIPIFDWNYTRISSFFIQNLDYIVIGDAPLLTLDDLLLMNISEIQINRTWMNGKDFNRFLKHWIAGSNPRLKYLSVGGLSKMDDDGKQFARELLHGIDHRKMADGEERTYVKYMGSYEELTETFSAGSYIRKKNGTKAIAHSERSWFKSVLQEFLNI